MEAYREYKKAKQSIEDSLQILEEENDEEMRELAKEELSDSRRKVDELEHQLKILLLPKGPPMTIRTLSWKSGPGPAGTRLPFSRRSFTVCTAITPTASAGRWR